MKKLYLSMMSAALLAGTCSTSAFERSAVNDLPLGEHIQTNKATKTSTRIDKRIVDPINDHKAKPAQPLMNKPSLATKPRVKFEIETLGAVTDVPFKLRSAKQANDEIDSASQKFVESTTVTPVCPTLQTGLLYTLSGMVSGNAACYHFEITERSKTTVLLVGQTPQTDADLTLLRHDEGDIFFPVVGRSATVGNSDEWILTMTEPGHYYWYIEVIEGDGSGFNFATVENHNADQFELNDIQALASVMPDRQNFMAANMDSAADVDHYSFTAKRGQSVLLSLIDIYGSDEWQLELLNGDWLPLNNNNNYVLNGLSPDQQVNVRVSPKPGVDVNPAHDYQLVLGSQGSLGSFAINGEPNIVRVPYGQTGYSLTDQAYNKLYWSINVVDTTGAPVEGAQVVYKVDKLSNFEYVDYHQVTGASGSAGGTVDLGTCGGYFYTEFYDWGSGLKVWWGTDFNIGYTKMEVFGGSGVGDISLGHICRQRVLRTEY